MRRTQRSGTFASIVCSAAVLAAAGLPAGPAHGDVTSGRELLGRLGVADESTSVYDRSSFQHWIDEDADGCDTRAEVLIEESLEVHTVETGCTVTAGRWYSPYDGASWTDPADVDIDHVVALSEAWQSGASGWSVQQRTDYANDLADDTTLLAVTDEVNASKGGSDASQWLPPLSSFDCAYATSQVVVKYRWDLSVDQVERAALADVLTGACGDGQVTLPSKGLTSTPAPAPGPGDRLAGGQELGVGEVLVASRGAHRLSMQGDGNAVVYDAAGRALWNSRTSGAGNRLVLQTDGNLVVYSGAGQALWHAGTYGNPGAFLLVQDDGNLVVYRANGSAAWHSYGDVPAPVAPVVVDTLRAGEQLRAGGGLVSGQRSYRALMQGDGNLVVYGPGGATWSSRTGAAGSWLLVQGDGNAVVYSPSGVAQWSARAGGGPGARLLMQDDGNLVLYSGGGAPVWHSAGDRPRPPAPPAPPAPPGLDPRFDTCREAKANGYGPYRRGTDPEYDWYRDADGDGIVCE